MNYIKNDYGQEVVSIGTPGSIERVKCQYPKLIKTLNNFYFYSFECYGKAVDEAILLIRKAGVTNSLETISILEASYYGNEQEGSVTSLIRRIK